MILTEAKVEAPLVEEGQVREDQRQEGLGGARGEAEHEAGGKVRVKGGARARDDGHDEGEGDAEEEYGPPPEDESQREHAEASQGHVHGRVGAEANDLLGRLSLKRVQLEEGVHEGADAAEAEEGEDGLGKYQQALLRDDVGVVLQENRE